MAIRQNIDSIIERLKTERDELNVRLHLARAELRDEYHDLEKRLGELESRGKRIREETGESAEQLEAATKLLAEEIKAGYERIRKAISE